MRVRVRVCQGEGGKTQREKKVESTREQEKKEGVEKVQERVRETTHN